MLKTQNFPGPNDSSESPPPVSSNMQQSMSPITTESAHLSAPIRCGTPIATIWWSTSSGFFQHLKPIISFAKLETKSGELSWSSARQSAPWLIRKEQGSLSANPAATWMHPFQPDRWEIECWGHTCKRVVPSDHHSEGLASFFANRTCSVGMLPSGTAWALGQSSFITPKIPMEGQIGW
jgi:hypothetical protein